MLFIIPLENTPSEEGISLRLYDNEGYPYEPMKPITDREIIKELVNGAEGAEFDLCAGVMFITLSSGAIIDCLPAEEAAGILIEGKYSAKFNGLEGVLCRILMPNRMNSATLRTENIPLKSSLKYGIKACNIFELEERFKAKIEKVEQKAAYCTLLFSETQIGRIIPAPVIEANATRYIDTGEILEPIMLRGKLWM